MARAGQTQAAAARNIGQGIRALGAGLEGISQGQELRGKKVDAEAERVENFETQRRFMEFKAQTEEMYTESLESVAPGAVGWQEQTVKSYQGRAKEFLSTVPDRLKSKYDNELFGEEDRIAGKARTFESTERKRYYGDEVDKGLNQLTSDLYANPNSFDQNVAAGNEFIDNIPDATFSQIEKDKLKKAWKEKAQLAALQGMSPEERIRKLGGVQGGEDGAASPGDAQKMTRGIKGDIRATISEAAIRHGVDPNAMLVIAYLESRGNPNAKNPKSSAKGLFQFIDSTAKQYGHTNRFDAAESSDAAARLARDNTVILERVLGRKPTTGELYLAHQQGAGGAAKLLSNPGAMAVDIVGADAVRLNGGKSDMTAGEFAALWMKKAGDVNIGEGSFKFDASKADPRFADMDYQTAQKMIDQSQIEIGKQQKAEMAAAANIAKQAAADAKAAAAQAVDDYNLAIELDPGNVTTEEVLADERIDNGQKASLIKKLEKANKGAIELQKAMVRANGDGLYNGMDSDDRKSANLAFEEMTKGTDDPEYFRLYGESFSSKGVVPKGYSDRIIFGAQSTSPANVAFAGSMASRLVENYPQAVNTSMPAQDRDKIQDLATSYDFMRNKMGLTDEQIGQRLIDRNDPEKMRQREQLMKSETVKEHLKTVTPEYVADQLSTGSGRIFDYTLGTDPAGAAAISGEWKRMFQENLGVTGSIAEATELTNSQFKRSYGPTPQGQAGDGAITYLPATLTYPPAPDGTHDYLQDQAIEALAEEGIKTDRVYFEHALDNGVNLTEQGHRKGISPEYQLYYDDENGERQAFPYPFYADPSTPTAMQNAEKAIQLGEDIRSARESNAKSAAREIERTAQIETGKPTKSVFDEMNEAVEEFETLPPPKDEVRDAPTAGGGGF